MGDGCRVTFDGKHLGLIKKTLYELWLKVLGAEWADAVCEKGEHSLLLHCRESILSAYLLKKLDKFLAVSLTTSFLVSPLAVHLIFDFLLKDLLNDVLKSNEAHILAITIMHLVIHDALHEAHVRAAFLEFVQDWLQLRLVLDCDHITDQECSQLPYTHLLVGRVDHGKVLGQHDAHDVLSPTLEYWDA